MLQMLRRRGLRISVSAVALLSLNVQPVMAAGKDDALNACGTERAGLVKLDKEYKDLMRTPKVVAETTAMLASNTAHLARLLKKHTYPGIG